MPIEFRSVQYASTGGAIVIMDVESGEYVGLSPVAALIWSELLDGAAIEDVIHRVRGIYDVEEERLRSDIRHFLTDCERRGWIQITASPGSDTAGLVYREDCYQEGKSCGDA